MSVIKFNETLKLLRNVSHDLRKFLKKEPIASNQTMRLMIEMYRKHDVTDQRVCRPQHELKYLAETYLSYINSSVNYKQIHDKFHSKGERSTEQTAHMVGLNMPKMPKLPENDEK